MKSQAIIREVKSFGSELRRYVGILRALLRQEEESRRHAPMEAILELTEPLFLIATMCMFRFMFERASSPSAMISPLGGSIVLYYASGLLPKYLFIYISVKRIGPAIAGPRRRFPIQRRLDSLIVHVILRIIDFTVLGILVFGGLYFLDTHEAFPYK